MSAISAHIKHIFKQGSTTYYYSSLFFPKDIKKKVFVLYSFVRIADDLVDQIPQQKKAFLQFRKEFESAYKKNDSKDEIIREFVRLMKNSQFDKKWVDAFLDAMQSDLHKKRYNTIEELEIYMYGSAEVIGLMMAKILQLPEASYSGARSLGKAMQYANFIRDVQEDNNLKRQYLPISEMKKWKLNSVLQDEVIKKQHTFREFMQEQILTYRQWQSEAEAFFHYIPYRYRIPIQTASEMYKWSMSIIFKDPFIVFTKKIKPSVFKIFRTTCKNSIVLLWK